MRTSAEKKAVRAAVEFARKKYMVRAERHRNDLLSARAGKWYKCSCYSDLFWDFKKEVEKSLSHAGFKVGPWKYKSDFKRGVTSFDIVVN